ncbi:MAG: O-antigen ligase family protein [Ktedonobacterales bacterium]
MESATSPTSPQPLMQQQRLMTIGVVAATLVALIALVALPTTLAGWLLFIGAALALTVIAPLGVLCVLPLAVAFGSLATLGIGGLRAGPTDLLVGLLTISGFAALARRRSRSRLAASFSPASSASIRAYLADLWQSHPERIALFGALLAYLGVIVLSLAVATSRTATLKEIVKWSEVIGVVALTCWLARGLWTLRLIAWGLIVAGVAQALLGCAQWALSSGSAGPGGANIRVFGTFDQPNPYGGFLNFGLPLALSLALFSRDVRERWVAAAATALLLIAQALADSRGALIGLAAAVIVIVVVGWRRERLAGVIALIGIPLALIAWFTHLIPIHIQQRILDQFRVGGLTLSCGANNGVNDANFSTVERLAHWVAGLRMFAAHPLLGVGAGNYNAAYPAYAIACWPEPLGHAHNYYINVAAETGLLGLLAFLALVAAALYAGWRATHLAQTAQSATTHMTEVAALRRALGIGFFAVVVALCAHNVTDDLYVHAMELQFALSLGCLLMLAPPRLPHNRATAIPLLPRFGVTAQKSD